MFFARFIRGQDREGRTTLAVGLVGGVLLCAWAGWFVLGRVSVYETSAAARLEVDRASHQVDALVAGRVVRSALALGRGVAAGDVLVELDAQQFRLALELERARLAGLEPQIAALKKELGEEQKAIAGEEAASTASRAEAQARQRARQSLADLKETERTQIEALRRAQHVAEVESQRSRAEAASQTAESEAARVAVTRIDREREVRRLDRRARVARLESEVASLERERALAAAQARVLEHEIEQRLVRAPVDGTIGDVAELRVGAVVQAGTRVATIVPAGRLRAVAFFDPATAVGRVRAGQRAKLRLHGFPWTQYGTIPATVTSVGSEPQGQADGRIRVELEVAPDPASAIPFQHGLAALVEVAVERLSPAALVLDAAGRFLDRRNAAAAPPVSAAR